MSLLWKRSDLEAKIFIATLVGLLCSCVGRGSSFETSRSLSDEPRRPDGVAVDLEGVLPPAQESASSVDMLLPLKEPVDLAQALTVIRAFFRTIAMEDLNAMAEILDAEAQHIPLGTGAEMALIRHWDQRFRKFDYTSEAEMPYRESALEWYHFDDLDGSLPNRPLRPADMQEGEVLVRVLIFRTRSGLDRVFGDEMRFVVRWRDSRFMIRSVYEDFVAP